MIVAMTKAVRSLLAVFLCAAAGAVSAGSVAVQVTDAAGKPLADAVVYVDLEGGQPANPKPATIEQRGLKFVPLVSVIQTGAMISFPNNDKVKHHIYSFSPAKKFDQKLYSGVAAAPQVFDKAGTVVLGCNIHDRMVAYVKVVDTPYFARSDADGMARIELPAAARATVSAWHYNMAGATAEQMVQLKGADSTPVTFRLAMKPPLADQPGQ